MFRYSKLSSKASRTNLMHDGRRNETDSLSVSDAVHQKRSVGYEVNRHPKNEFSERLQVAGSSMSCRGGLNYRTTNVIA